MSNLKIGHVVEAALWLLLVAVLYAGSFDFDREIEIYKFGASAWPRVILLLVAIAAIGQLAYHWVAGVRGVEVETESSSDSAQHYAGLRWYLWTFFLLSLPFVYLLLPQWIMSQWSTSWSVPDKETLHTIKLICAGVLILLYVIAMRGNPVGGILTLPIFFGALLQDFGFYSLAPVFAAGVMYLMGERRPSWIALSAAVIMGLVLLLFVSVLYVGLPTGNISPFYEIGTGLVTLLQ